MKTKITAILTSLILLAVSTNIFAEAQGEVNAPPARPQIRARDAAPPVTPSPAPGGQVVRARQGRRLQQQQGLGRDGQRQQIRARERIRRQEIRAGERIERQRIRARAGIQRQRIRATERVERQQIRARASVQRQQIRTRARLQRQEGRTGQRASRPAVQTFNRWFEALKQAYQENNTERVGNLIRRMEQLRNNLQQAQPGRGGPQGTITPGGGRQMQRRQRLQGGIDQPQPQGSGPVRQRQQRRLGPPAGPEGQGPAGREMQPPQRRLRQRNRRGDVQQRPELNREPNAEEFDWDF